MEKVIIENENGENRIELFLTNEEIKPFLDKAYADAQKNLKIPGFRPGHIPVNLIKNMYGKSIEADTNIEIVNDYFPRIATEESLVLLSNPNLLDIQKSDDGVKYIISYQTIPDFQINDYKENITIFEPVHIVQNEEIDNRIDELAFSLAEREPAELVESFNYLVKFNITTHHHHEMNDEHEHHHDDEHEHNHDHSETNTDEIYLNHPQIDAEFRDIFLNRKVGEKFSFSPEKDPEHNYEIEITEINQVIPPALDDEFAQKISQNKFDTLEELRNDIALELQDNWDEESKMEMNEQLRERLIRDNWDVFIPDQLMQFAQMDYLKAVKKQYNIPEKETGLDATLIQYAGDAPKKIALWELLRSKLYKLENVEVEDTDIEIFVEKQNKYFQGMQIDAAIDLIKKNEDILARLKEQKLFEILLGYATTEEISFDDYAAKKEIQARENAQSSIANDDNETPVEAATEENIDLQDENEDLSKEKAEE